MRSRGQRAREIEYVLDRYKAAHPEDDGGPIEPHVIAPWAIRRGLWKRPPLTSEEILRKEIASFLKSEYIKDPQGREVRKNHALPMKVKTPEGKRRYWRYYDIYHAPEKHMLGSLQIRRRGMVADAIQLDLDWASYNDNNVFGAKLPPLDYNLTLDVQESKLPTTYPE
jgi:hypothetical protein